MKTAREKGVETIINPAPAIPLPNEAYRGLGHLIVNETEAEILSGIEKPTDWDEVASVFISRGVKNVIITLGGDVRIEHLLSEHLELIAARVFTIKPTSDMLSPSLENWSPLARCRLLIPLPLVIHSLVLIPLLSQGGSPVPRKPISTLMLLSLTPTELHR